MNVSLNKTSIIAKDISLKTKFKLFLLFASCLFYVSYQL